MNSNIIDWILTLLIGLEARWKQVIEPNSFHSLILPFSLFYRCDETILLPNYYLYSTVVITQYLSWFSHA